MEDIRQRDIPNRQREAEWKQMRVLIDMETELGITVSSRHQGTVLSPKKIHGDMSLLQFRRDIREPLFEIFETVVTVCWITSGEYAFQFRLLLSRSTGMGMPLASAILIYLFTVPLYRSSFRPIDRFDSPSR